MRVLALIFSWFLGVLFLVLAIASLFYSASTSVPLLLLALMFLPPVRRYIHEKTGRSFPRKAKKIVVPVLVIAALVLVGGEMSRRDDEKAAIALQKRIDRYHEQKPSVVDSINAAISRSDFESAILQIDRYAFAEDSELMAIKRIATEKQEERVRNERRDQILAELRGVPATEFGRKKELYGELLQLFPTDAAYQAKYDDYSTKPSKKQERERLAAERAAREARKRAARKESIESSASLFQGTVADWRRASHSERIAACEAMV